MAKRKNPPWEREIDTKKLHELYERLATAQPGKEARELHKELKKFGDGVPFFYRYPNFPLIISIIALLVSLTKLFLSGMTL